jgi:hypothetical protein
MKLGMTLLGELQEMKEKMDLVWNDLFDKKAEKEEEAMQWVERLPKSEGTGRRSLRPRSNKTIRSF